METLYEQPQTKRSIRRSHIWYGAIFLVLFVIVAAVIIARVIGSNTDNSTQPVQKSSNQASGLDSGQSAAPNQNVPSSSGGGGNSLLSQ